MARTPLIVVALKEEAAHLDSRYPVLVTGVGKVSAALAVTRYLATRELPSEVINIGTAGALRAGLGGTQEIKEVIQHDFDSPAIEALTGQACGLSIMLRPDGPVLATGDVFVSDPTLRENLALRGRPRRHGGIRRRRGGRRLQRSCADHQARQRSGRRRRVQKLAGHSG